MQKPGRYFQALEKILLRLLIFLLPTQIGLHFWPAWAFVAGIRVDYLSPTIYLTDILIISLLIVSVINKTWYKRKNFWILIVGLIAFALINSLSASNPAGALLKWGKVAELVLLFFYTSYSSKEIRSVVVQTIPFSIIFFAAIGFAQIVLQRTIGGPFYWLGERSFTAMTPGIALYNFLGKLFLGPYSTFPHPNVFGAYMFVASYILIVLKNRKSFFDYFAILIGLVAAILSGSMAVYIGMFVVFILMFTGKVVKKFLKLMTIGAILLSFAFLLISPKLSPQHFSESIGRRLSLARVSAYMVSKEPLFGIGLNNFVVNLPVYASKDPSLWVLQPVHNIFLLTFVETGIVGLLLLGYLLHKSLRKKSYLVLSLVFVIVTGLFDHYWLTLQQPQILFALLVGLLW